MTTSWHCSLDPFQWAWLQMAKTPFSDEIANLVLDKLKDLEFVQDLCDDLRRLFRVSFSSNTVA